MFTTSTLNKKKLQETIDELSTQTDVNGTTIDPGIITTVALLNMHGFPTYSSCEGHVDKAKPYGWIKFITPTEAAERALQANGASIYYLLSEKAHETANRKTKARFGNQETWDKKADEFYGQIVRETLRRHINYNYYVDISEKIRTERKELREKINDFLYEFLSFQRNSVTISKTGSVKILFASENEISLGPINDLSLEQKKVLKNRSQKLITVFNEFLEYSF